jgi:vacuolar protein-sorting-associated protein 4
MDWGKSKVSSFNRPSRIKYKIHSNFWFRKVRFLFELARENSPSIIFIDEIDSVCSSRSSDSNDHRTGMKTELLVQMDGVGHDNKGVFVLAATNVPWRLDSALLSRLQRKIYIPLPDGSARRQQLKKNPVFKLTSDDVSYYSKATKGLSGRDIDILLHESFEIAKSRILKAKYFCKILVDGKKFYEPCESSTSGAIKMTWKDVPSGMLQRPIPESEDMINALKKIKPTVSKEDEAKFTAWTEKFGSHG